MSLFRRLWARRWVKAILIAFAVFAPIAAATGIKGWRYVKTDPEFCVSCHLMEAPAEKWRHSAHKGVACQTCHRADIFEEMKLGYAAIILQQKEIPSHTKLPISICQECHVSGTKMEKQIVSTPGHASHFVGRGISCLDCHAQKVHEFGADAAVCKRCHGAERMKLDKMADVHCFQCHDFLGKKGSSLIPTAATCRECHDEEDNPVLKGHEDCMGCHRPHGASQKDPMDCLSCHPKLLDPSNRHYKDQRLTSCRQCHEPHGKTPTILSAVEKREEDVGPLPGKYAGETTCRRCHFQKHKTWKDTAHVNSFEVLPPKYRDDATCTKCHATGLGHPGGFVSAERTPDMKGVQCEACHGPSAEHAAFAKENAHRLDDTAVRTMLLAGHLPPARQCVRCHLPQRHGKHPDYEPAPK